MPPRNISPEGSNIRPIPLKITHMNDHTSIPVRNKSKTLKRGVGKLNLFKSNANRLKQIQNEANAVNAANTIQYGDPKNNILPDTKNKALNALPSGERPFLTRMKSFVTRPFRSSPEATLTKSSTNSNNYLNKIMKGNRRSITRKRTYKREY
jgi:hypothetical protein